MTVDEKLILLKEIFEPEDMPKVVESALLKTLTWDSMARLSFIAMLDQNFNKKITARQIQSYTSIQDLLNVMD